MRLRPRDRGCKQVVADGFAPADWPADPSHEWCALELTLELFSEASGRIPEGPAKLVLRNQLWHGFGDLIPYWHSNWTPWA